MTRDVILSGTAITEAPKRLLRAGKLEAHWDAGALRWIRWNGVEVMRGILFLVRTPGWGTPAGTLDNVHIDERDDGFEVSYDACFGTRDTGVMVAIRFSGSSGGTLRAESVIRVTKPFETNRTGFVVLHPLDGFAGSEVTVEHASTPARKLTIPARLSPGQPVMDMTAITHCPVNSLTVETRFIGDIFEMEDHRQWSDASFKTYSRPIGLPYPYMLSPNEPIEQGVTLTITDTAEQSAHTAASSSTTSAASPPAALAAQSLVKAPAISGQCLPHFALPLDSPAHVVDALAHLEAIQQLALTYLLLKYDVRISVFEDFAPLSRLLSETGSALELQVILQSATESAMDKELEVLSARLVESGITVARVSGFASVDEQSFQPGEVRPPHPSEAAIRKALRRHFPDAAAIGGTPAFFTEFNRKRPDAALWQGLTFATCPLVHAADDASVMETLQALPHILASATVLADGQPIAIGPTGIGMRLNPYGPAPLENDPAARTEMAGRDPRQRGLFAAAWIVGYLARIAPYGIERFAFGAPVGPFGLISTRQAYAQPIWDDLEEGALLPIYHVARWIASAGGARLVAAVTEGHVACVVWEKESRRHALIANLSTTPCAVPDLPLIAVESVLLDATQVLDFAWAPDCSSGMSTGQIIPDQLDALALLRITGESAK